MTKGKSDNKEQTIFETKSLWIHKVKERDKWWEELEDMEDCIEEEAKKMVEDGEEGWRREGKVIFWKEQVDVPDSATLREQII